MRSRLPLPLLAILMLGATARADDLDARYAIKGIAPGMSADDARAALKRMSPPGEILELRSPSWDRQNTYVSALSFQTLDKTENVLVFLDQFDRKVREVNRHRDYLPEQEPTVANAASLIGVTYHVDPTLKDGGRNGFLAQVMLDDSGQPTTAPGCKDTLWEGEGIQPIADHFGGGLGPFSSLSRGCGIVARFAAVPADANHALAMEIQQHVVDERLAVADILKAKGMATQAQTAATSKQMDQAGKVQPSL